VCQHLKNTHAVLGSAVKTSCSAVCTQGANRCAAGYAGCGKLCCRAVLCAVPMCDESSQPSSLQGAPGSCALLHVSYFPCFSCRATEAAVWTCMRRCVLHGWLTVAAAATCLECLAAQSQSSCALLCP
jgi:hypothetical protein